MKPANRSPASASASPACSSPSRAAFSLLEMLLALAIFAILLGIVLASMPRWQQKARLKRATELTQSGLEFARSRANAVNRRTTFICTNSMTRPVTGSFLVQDDSSLTCPQPAKSLPVGVAFASATNITFVPGSRTTSEGNVSLTLEVWVSSFPSNILVSETLLVSAASATVRQIQ